MNSNANPEQQSAAIAALWYTAPKPPPPAGWLVYSAQSVLRGLRGDLTHQPDQSVTAGWRLAVGLVRGLMGLGQAILMLLSWIPVLSTAMETLAVYFKRGALGYFIRACYWKTKLKRLGQDTLIDRGVEIWGPRNIEIGAGCHLDTYVRLAAGESAYGQKGHISIGDYTHIGPRCHLVGRGDLTIGSFVALEAGVHVYSATNTLIHPQHPGQTTSLSHVSPEEFQHIAEAPVEIADYVVVGFSSLVLPGVSLGQAAVVHPYAVVSKSFPAFANITGPGRARQNGWRRPPKLDPRRLQNE